MTLISNLPRQLWGDIPSGWAIIWNKTSKQSIPIRADDYIGLEACVQTLLAEGGEVYFGIGLQERPPVKGRGTAASVIALGGLFLDLDIAGDGHAQKALPTAQEAQEFAASLHPAPSIAINTGGGLHLYWPFDHLWNLKDPGERDKAATLLARWQRHIIALGSRRGWRIDFTGDLARILRLPGTRNLKIPGRPREVTVAYWNDQRFSIEQLSAAIPPEPAPTHRAPQKRKKKPLSPASSERLRHCGWVENCVTSSATVPEPAWYALLTLLARCDDGREAAHQWSSDYPGYSQSETDQKFDHALNSPGPATCQRIRKELGGEDFCETCPYANKVSSPITLTDPAVILSADWVYVASIGLFHNVKDSRCLSKEAFSDYHSDILKNGSAARELLNSRHLTRAVDYTFQPGHPVVVHNDNDIRINIWVNDGVPSQDGDPKPILDHLHFVIPDNAERDHFIRWMAYPIQNPGRRAHHGVLLIGKQGTGKSLIGRLLKLIHGPANCAEVGTDELHSKFVDWLEGKSLVIIEELLASGRLELGNKLKPLFTSPTIRIDVKFQRPREIQVLASILAFSNHTHAIHLEPGDRRFFVINSPAEPQNSAYYVRLATWIEKYAGAFRRYLETVNLSDFQPAAAPPMTAAKAELIETSRAPLEWTIRHMLAEGIAPFDADVVTSEGVLQAVRQEAPRATLQATLGVLKALGALKLPRLRVGAGMQVSPWAIRRPEIWSQATSDAVRAELQGQRRVA